MNDLNSDQRVPGAAPDVGVAEDDKMDFVKVLRARRGTDHAGIGLVFSYPKLEVVFVNDMGEKALCPTFEAGACSYQFSLRDVISVEDRRLFDSKVFPMLQIAGRWSGQISLRDLWGGDISLEVEIWTERLETRGGERFLFLLASPSRTVSIDSLQGWQDRELLLALMAHSKDCIYFKDGESRFLRASRSLIKKVGLNYPHEIIGKTDFHFFDISHATAAYEDEQKIMATGEPVLDKEECEILDDGSEYWSSTTKLPLLDSEGVIVGTFGISRDITSRKSSEKEKEDLETRLHIAQRLEAIGSLAAGVAHEINTPTQFVADNVKFLDEAFRDLSSVLAQVTAFAQKAKAVPELQTGADQLLSKLEEVDYDFLIDEIPQTINQSADGLRQIGKIVGSMKEFSYPSGMEKSKVDINHAVENTLIVARNSWKTVAEIETSLDPKLPEVECLIDEINQVILNLIVNATQAIEETETRQGKITLSTYQKDGFVCIEIADTGVGMSDEIRSRIFEPFFTTKEVGRGTGQGLAMAMNIVVKKHQGRIECDSELGEGTTFRVWLPVKSVEEAEQL